MTTAGAATGTATGAATFDGFVHAADGRLVDGRGRPLQWRGMGLGNWLLPEGYMWRLFGPVSSPRRIEAMIADLVGDARAAEFWVRFRDVFVAEADIAAMAAAGFDHVRVAINSRVVMDDDGRPLADGFALIDRLVDWCRTHRLWVVLDLHGAPGGQTGTNIDDSPNGRPELFEQAHYRERTIALWTTIAERYRDETVVAGYDLLNEPIPDDYQHRYADHLAQLYRDLTAAIRAVDPDHLIMYEGSHWATNWSIFTEVWDENSMLQFHKYWSPPERPSIQQYLDARTKLGLPIYMGEGGENSLDWFQTAFQLFEDHEIGWNFWPWKKIDTLTSPCSIDAPDGWDEIVAWANGRGARPGPDAAWDVLVELLDRMRFERCTHRPEVVEAMMRRAPLRLPASGFTFAETGRSIRAGSATPLAGFRADADVTIRCVDGGTPYFGSSNGDRYDGATLEVVLGSGDWVEYEVNVATEDAGWLDGVPSTSTSRPTAPRPFGSTSTASRLNPTAARRTGSAPPHRSSPARTGCVSRPPTTTPRSSRSPSGCPAELRTDERAVLEPEPDPVAVRERSAPRDVVTGGQAGDQGRLDAPAVGDDQRAASVVDDADDPLPELAMDGNDAGQLRTAGENLDVPNVGQLPPPLIVVVDHAGDVTTRQLHRLVHRAAHRDGGLDSPLRRTGHDELERPGSSPRTTRESHSFGGQV